MRQLSLLCLQAKQSRVAVPCTVMVIGHAKSPMRRLAGEIQARRSTAVRADGISG